MEPEEAKDGEDIEVQEEEVLEAEPKEEVAEAQEESPPTPSPPPPPSGGNTPSPPLFSPRSSSQGRPLNQGPPAQYYHTNWHQQRTPTIVSKPYDFKKGVLDPQVGGVLLVDKDHGEAFVGGSNIQPRMHLPTFTNQRRLRSSDPLSPLLRSSKRVLGSS